MSGLFFASFFTGGSDWLLLAGMLPVFFIIAKLIKFSFKDAALTAVFFTAAFCAGSLYNHFVYGKITSYSGTEGSFTGEVTEAGFYKNEKASYTLKGRINGVQQAKVIYFGDAYNVEIGDVMTLENCKFVIPESDYLFDSESYYRSKNIFLAAENAESASVQSMDSHRLKRFINGYREKIISDFMIKMGETRGSFLSGIVFGETSDMDNSTKTLMYRCGVGHIMAVSGLHVSIAAAMLMFLFGRLRFNRYASFALMNLFILLMIIMVESPVSVIRAAIMLDFMYSARLFRRQNDTFNALSAAVLLICLSNPFAVYDRGFLLSIAGTFGIGVFAPYMTSEMKYSSFLQKLVKNAASMFCVMLSVMPLNILFFDETSLISAFTNVLIIPLCIAAMALGMIYVISAGTVSLLSVSGLLIDIVLSVTDRLGRLEFTHFSCGSRRLFLIAALCTVFVVLTYSFLKKRRYTALAIAGALAVFTFTSSLYSRLEQNKFKIAILGRGANAAAVISYKGRTDVIDLSGHYKSAEYVRKYLISNGISEIGSIFFTNDVQSQYSAYEKALELIEIENHLAAGNNAVAGSVLFGDRDFTIKSDDYTVNYSGDALKIKYGEAEVMLIPARAEVQDEAELFVRYGSITKNTEIFHDGRNIYLDRIEDSDYRYSDMNNLEIIISAENGELTVRRL